MNTTITCRRAEAGDIDALVQLIESYAAKGILLPRTRETVTADLADFAVAEADGRLVGCGSLCRLGDQLAEVRSLGLEEGYKGKGIGSRIVSFLVEEARRRNFKKVMALTYEVKFFERNGFRVVPKDVFPEKVWKDCVICRKRHCCDEIAVLKTLD